MIWSLSDGRPYVVSFFLLFNIGDGTTIADDFLKGWYYAVMQDSEVNAGDPTDLILTPTEALAELHKRRQNPALKKKIEEYFKGDIPEYLKGEPVMYMARHIGTPNFETLRFIHLVRELGLPIIISQDSKGIFVTQNHVKKALCKLPVCRRLTQKAGKLNEQYENMTIVDFNAADGKMFSEIQTLWGEGLIEFHTRLFSELGFKKIEFPDDAEWLDRHNRGKLLDHYKELLMLFVVHGVFLENYNFNDPQEVEFVKNILRPACEYVREQTGFLPLISPIFPTEFESYDFWISYPSEVRDIIKNGMKLTIVPLNLTV